MWYVLSNPASAFFKRRIPGLALIIAALLIPVELILWMYFLGWFKGQEIEIDPSAIYRLRTVDV